MLNKENILLVDDDIDILELLQRHLSAMGYHCYKAVSVREALQVLPDAPIDLLITDINMPEVDGIELVKHASEHYPDMALLVITGFPSVEDALEVIKSGAVDYLTKPFTKAELQTAVSKALKTKKKTRPQAEQTRHDLGTFQEMIGRSEAFLEMTDVIQRVKDNRATVLVLGESGTGKELVARAIHYSGKFGKQPFIAVNCGAIPQDLLEAELFGYTKGAFTGANENRKGFFQAAHGGTIFLDEIGNASLAVQAKLLRVLQEKEVIRVGSQKTEKIEVRIIAATNNDLNELMAQKSFREDLYYRLSVVTIKVPALRDRKNDIEPLAKKFLQKYGAEYKDRVVPLSDEALGIIERYSWPGNIRELENVILRAVIMSNGKVTVKELPDRLKYKINIEPEAQTLKEVELLHIKKILAQTEGNKTQAAKILGITRKTLRDKLKQ